MYFCTVLFGSCSLMMHKIRWLFLILIAVFTLILVFQNQAPTEIQLIFWKHSLPLSLLLISTTTIGFLLGALLTASMLRQRKKKELKSRKQSPKPAIGKEKATNPSMKAAAEEQPFRS